MAYKVRINGQTHTVTVVDGVAVYDPPLSESRIAKDRDNLRDILVSRKCPSCQTETSWSAGRGTLLDQMDGDEAWTRHVVKQSQKHGYTPGSHDIYLTQLARFAGDPQAFVKPSDGRAQVARICKQRGAGCEGSVNVQARPYTPKPGPKLNPKIAKQMMRAYRREKMVDASVSDTELRELVVKTHGRQD